MKSPKAILAFIKSLQRSMVQKLVRKTSPLASEVNKIQGCLIDTYNKMAGDLRFEIDEKTLGQMVSIAGGEEVYPSIKIIRRYIGMQGKVPETSKLNSFTTQIQKAIKSEKVKTNDPYYTKVRNILTTLKKASKGPLKITKTELNGLVGILKACSHVKGLDRISKTSVPKPHKSKKGTHLTSRGGGPRSRNRDLSGVLTAEEMANREFQTLGFDGTWQQLLGNPAPGFTMMWHGEPHSGKTTILLKFAQYLAQNFGKVMYVSSEEFASPTMTQKVRALSPLPTNLHFSENLKKPDLSNYEFIVLDSVNDLNLRLDDFKEIKARHPQTSFIMILQHTKDGQFKGGKDWEHAADIVGEVSTGGIINITKNRYHIKTSMNLFNPKID